MSVVPATSAPVDISTLATVENDADKNQTNVKAVVNSLIAAEPGIDKELVSESLQSILGLWTSSTPAHLKITHIIWYPGVSILCPEVQRKFLGRIFFPVNKESQENNDNSISYPALSGILFFHDLLELLGHSTFTISYQTWVIVIEFFKGTHPVGLYIGRRKINPRSASEALGAAYTGSGTWSITA